MRSRSWFGKLWKRLSSGVVQDVPARLEACEMCREVDCTQERWESCEQRLAAEAARTRDERAEAADLRVVAGPAVQPDVVRKPKPVSS